MSNLGLGVMINMLGGNEDSVKAFQDSIGKKIAALKMDEEERLVFTFDDNTRMALFDDGQSCCEHRYMTTDDDLQSFVGSTLNDAETREGGEAEEDYEYHETQFLLITTSKGVFTMETHNEHNGYYGGFWVVAKTLVEND